MVYSPIKEIVYLLDLDKLRCVEMEFISIVCRILQEKQDWLEFDFAVFVQRQAKHHTVS